MIGIFSPNNQNQQTYQVTHLRVSLWIELENGAMSQMQSAKGKIMSILEHSIATSERTMQEPFVVMLHRWYLESKSAISDLLVALTLGGGAFFLLITHDFTEVFFEITREFEHIQLDEILFTSIFVMAIIFPAFAIRRWLDALRYLRDSNTDSLTKLANRRQGWSILEGEVARAARYQGPLSIIIFDLDNFKQVNDKYGHLKGDHLLEGVATTLHSIIRPNDTLVRWGGEEFLVILSGTDRGGAFEMAERLRKSLENASLIEGLKVTASLGVAQWQLDETIETFIHRADKKLYEAKAKGRNRVA